MRCAMRARSFGFACACHGLLLLQCPWPCTLTGSFAWRSYSLCDPCGLPLARARCCPATIDPHVPGLPRRRRWRQTATRTRRDTVRSTLATCLATFAQAHRHTNTPPCASARTHKQPTNPPPHTRARAHTLCTLGEANWFMRQTLTRRHNAARWHACACACMPPRVQRVQDRRLQGRGLPAAHCDPRRQTDV